MYELEYLTLLGYGAKGAVYQAHPAGNASLIVYLCPAVLVGADGIHAAGTGTGALHLQYGAVGAHILAAAALNTLVHIYDRLAVTYLYGSLGTDLLAGVFQTALTYVRHMVVECGA